MKGNLIKTEQGWFVQYIGHPVDVLKGEENLVNHIPLHPNNNIEVEFEILDGYANIQKKEISDEDIENAAANAYNTPHAIWGFRAGANWCREQLKKK